MGTKSNLLGTREQKVFAAIKKHYYGSALDDHIHEIMALKVSNINNGGIDEQLRFLADEAGLNWLEEIFLCPVGESIQSSRSKNGRSGTTPAPTATSLSRRPRGKRRTTA